MTPRSLPQRLAAWLMVALLALTVGEPLRAHVCPMHDGAVLVLLAGGAGGGAAHGAAHGGTHAPAPGAHGSEGATHGDGAHGDGAHADAGAPGHPAPHGCQCVGACCVTAPVATPASALAITATTALVSTAVAAPAVPVAVPGTGDVVLPFAIGPPLAV